MTAKDCLTLITHKLKLLKETRKTKQIELSCLSTEIDRLEDLGFEIERQLERDGGVDD